MPASQVLELLVLLLPHNLQFSLMSPPQALQLRCQAPQEVCPLLLLLQRCEEPWVGTYKPPGTSQISLFYLFSLRSVRLGSLSAPQGQLSVPAARQPAWPPTPASKTDVSQTAFLLLSDEFIHQLAQVLREEKIGPGREEAKFHHGFIMSVPDLGC